MESRRSGTGGRVPLAAEAIAGLDAVIQYDRGAKLYMKPEYKYFVWKVLKGGARTGRVLDVGTGSGLLAIELARVKGCEFDIWALDISEDMIRRARDNAELYGVEKKTTFVQGTAAALPFRSGSFDLVISYASLHHWFEPEAVFGEMERVLRPSGRVIVRDNKRVYESRVWSGIVWFVSRFMNRRHRENWPKAIRASYTVPEVKEMLDRSGRSHYRVRSDFVLIDLCIESPGLPQGRLGG
jgi:ubiquinone/menaquinone biosynthesis C-methylase UbiE